MTIMTMEKALEHPLLMYLWKAWFSTLTYDDYDTYGRIPVSWIAGFTDKGFCGQLTEHITKDKGLSLLMISLWVGSGELPEDFDDSWLRQ